MGFGSELSRRSWATAARRTPRSAAAVVAACLLLAALGCGADRGERTSAGKAPGGNGGGSSETGATTARETRPAPGSNRVVLTDKMCVNFAPHWTTIRVGQSLTWVSELKRPVTIHVPTGAFDRTEFTVRAGGSVTSGPARQAGSYPMTTDPSACRGIPRGTEGPAPGVTIEGGD